MKKAAAARKILTVLLGLLLLAGLAQWGFDRRGGSQEGGSFSNEGRLLDFLGGARQYLAYSLFIKVDKLDHEYCSSQEKEAGLIPYFLLATALDPKYVRCYYLAAPLMQDFGQSEEAIHYALDGVTANPDSGDLRFTLGMLYFLNKRYEEASRAFNEALQLDTQLVTKPLIYQGLSACYKGLGDEARARGAQTMSGITLGIEKYGTDLDGTMTNNLVNAINANWNSALSSETGE